MVVILFVKLASDEIVKIEVLELVDPCYDLGLVECSFLLESAGGGQLDVVLLGLGAEVINEPFLQGRLVDLFCGIA